MTRAGFRIIYLIPLSVFLFSFVLDDSPAVVSGNHLFKIGRSRDANEIFYDLNLRPDGKPDVINPIRIYWLKHTENGKTEPLTTVQRKLAYGIRVISFSDDKVDFQFVSYSGRTFSIRKTKEHGYRVLTNLRNQEVEVNRIFIQFDGGTYWFPSIASVDLYGTGQANGSLIIEKVHP